MGFLRFSWTFVEKKIFTKIRNISYNIYREKIHNTYYYIKSYCRIFKTTPTRLYFCIPYFRPFFIPFCTVIQNTTPIKSKTKEKGSFVNLIYLYISNITFFKALISNKKITAYAISIFIIQ